MTAQQLADDVCVAAEDVLALVELYYDGQEDLWEEEGVLSTPVVDAIAHTLNPHCERTVPQLWIDRPVEVTLIPNRVAWVEGDKNVVHQLLAVRNGVTKCGRPIEMTVDGETVTDEQEPCARCWDPDW